MNTSGERLENPRMGWEAMNMAAATMDKYRSSPSKVDDRMMSSPCNLSISPKSCQDGGHQNSNSNHNHSSSTMMSDDQCRRYRTNYSRTQIARLEEEFRREKYLSRPRRCELASELGLKENTIKVWFQNRRMKEKRQITSLALPVFANADPNLYAFLMESANAYMNYTANNGMPPPSTAQPSTVPLPPSSTDASTFSSPPGHLYNHQAGLYHHHPSTNLFTGPPRHHPGLSAVPTPTGPPGYAPINSLRPTGYEAHLRLAMEQLEQQSHLYAALQAPSMALFDRGFSHAAASMLPIFNRSSIASHSSPSPPETSPPMEDPVKLKITPDSSSKLKLFRPFVLSDDN